MIRILGAIIGLGFSFVVLWGFANGAYNAATEHAEVGAEHVFHLEPKEVDFQHDGPFGTWDVAQLQRGYQVYKEVCSACHSMKFVAYRDFAEIGYNQDEVKALAAENKVPGVDPNTGEATMRTALPTDYLPSPYPNKVAAAAANNNAIPPDLSLMTKAREGGAAYVYSLLTGYTDPATFEVDGKSLKAEHPEFTTGPGLHFNPYFANLNIAMTPPLTSEGQVTYADGTKATIDQMAKDVSAFLTWTAEPTLIKRKQTGWPVLGFLLFATILAWMSKKQIWSAAKPRKAS